LVGGVEKKFRCASNNFELFGCIVPDSGFLLYNSIRPEILARRSSMPDSSGDFEADDVGLNAAGKRLIRGCTYAMLRTFLTFEMIDDLVHYF
jgi:hypothetical protein